MKSTEFLQAAIDVQAERGKQYDTPEGERSMGRTIQAFNALTGRDLRESEGWLLMLLLKQARQWQNPAAYHHDSALDGVAYASLLAESLSSGRGERESPEVWACPGGGGRPCHAATQVEVQYRNSVKARGQAGFFDWLVSGDSGYDIVAWRPVDV